MPYLATRFTVIAPDLIGHGESGQAARRLLARRLRERRARPDGHTRPRERHLRRPFARRRGRRCSSPTSSLSAASAWCWSTAAASAARSTSCCDRPPCRSRRSCCRCWRAPRCSTPAAPSAAASDGSGCGPARTSAELARGHASLADREARAAFVHTLRTIVDPGGQRVNATDRLYLAENVPFMLVVGRAGLDHPGRARPGRPRARALEQARDLRERGPLPAHRRPSALSWTCCSTSSTRPSRPTSIPSVWQEMLQDGRELPRSTRHAPAARAHR